MQSLEKLENARRQIQPEDEVLLCVGRVDRDGENAGHLSSLLRCDLDWEYLLDSARRHGLVPGLHQCLSPMSTVPAEVKSGLRDESHALQVTNLLLTHELLRVLILLQSEGIRAIPFKGPTLTMMAYGNLALRQFDDLDFLLPPVDIPRARTVLSLHGYRSQHPLGRTQEDAYFKSLCQLPLVHEETSILVELHSKVTPRDFSIGNDPTFLQRLMPVSLLGKEVLTFSREDLLLILCVHGAKHIWGCLGWVCDVASLISVSPEMDWDLVTRLARRNQCERILSLGLFLAHELSGAPLPPGILSKIENDKHVLILAKHVWQRLFNFNFGNSGFSDAFFHLRVRERWFHGVRYSLSLALSPTLADWSSLTLPKPLSFFYYPVRFRRLLGKYGPKPGQAASTLS